MKTKRLFTIFIFGVCIIASALFLGINTAHAAKAEQTLDNLNEIPKYESNFIKIEILRGMSAYIDLTQKTGEVDIYKEDGTFTVASYKITQTDNGEYITFVREPKHNYNSEILELNPKANNDIGKLRLYEDTPRAQTILFILITQRMVHMGMQQEHCPGMR